MQIIHISFTVILKCITVRKINSAKLFTCTYHSINHYFRQKFKLKYHHHLHFNSNFPGKFGLDGCSINSFHPRGEKWQVVFLQTEWSFLSQYQSTIKKNKYSNCTHTHTPVSRPFSGTTWVGQYQKGKTNLDFTEARDSERQWHQLGHMQVCTSL